MLKKYIAAFLICVSLSGCTTTKTGYENIENSFVSSLHNNGIDDFTIYNSNEITRELLDAEDKIVIERCIGEVLNEKGDGKILNAADEDYDYISYRGITENRGTTVLTYFIYNSENDDIVERYDFILKERCD